MVHGCAVKIFGNHNKVLDPSFIQETIEVWQPLSSTPLTVEDAHEIIRNITAFFDLLAEWKQAEIAAEMAVGKAQGDQTHKKT